MTLGPRGGFGMGGGGGGTGVIFAESYYVDQATGNDANPGTVVEPFATFSKGLTESANSRAAYTRLYVAAGTYTGAFSVPEKGVGKVIHVIGDLVDPSQVQISGVGVGVGTAMTLNRPDLVFRIEGTQLQSAQYGIRNLAGTVILGFNYFDDLSVCASNEGINSSMDFATNTDGDCEFTGPGGVSGLIIYNAKGARMRINQSIATTNSLAGILNEGFLFVDGGNLDIQNVATPGAYAFKTTNGGVTLLRGSITADGQIVQSPLSNANVMMIVDNGTVINDASVNMNADDYYCTIQLMNNAFYLDDATWTRNGITVPVIYDGTSSWKSPTNFDTTTAEGQIAFVGNATESGHAYTAMNFSFLTR